MSAGRAHNYPDGKRHKVEDWLEWEENILREGVTSQQPEALPYALEQLNHALSATGNFLGRELTVADIAIFYVDLRTGKDVAYADVSL